MTPSPVPAHPVRLLVVDDSPSIRAVIRAMLEGDPGIQIVGEAGTGVEAVAMARTLRPGVILMDVQMPEMDGIEATERIMASDAVPIIAFSAFTWGGEAKASIEMLAAGALDVMAKPDLGGAGEVRDCSRVLRKKIRSASCVVVVRHLRRTVAASRERRVPAGPSDGTRFEALGVGASTGGPTALRELFSRLPADFPIPILVVQHITAGFTAGFVEWLRQQTALEVRVANEEDRAAPGSILIAPEGRQLEVIPGGAVRATSRKANGVHLPSADTLLSSLASAYGPKCIGVLLTGMGSDGAEGLLDIRRAGGFTLAQDEETCVVFGMPREAVRRGAVIQSMAPASMAELLRRMAERSRRREGGDHV
ncbi:MAG: chemotaxis-specific protein-glutamate methyltransferase CheB [bacterium]|jgi:two-component system chemotaxis response regulator CheB